MAPNRKRPRYIEGSVENLVRDVLDTEHLDLTQEAMEALVLCHNAFLQEISRGLLNATSLPNDSNPINPSSKKAPSKKQATAASVVKDQLERHCEQHMKCGDLWNQAVQLLQAEKQTNNNYAQQTAKGTKAQSQSAKKKRPTKKKNKNEISPELLAEQERLLEASKQKALGLRKQEQQT